MRQQKNAELMAAGVTLEDPATTYIDRDVDDRRRHDHPSRRVARRAARRSAPAARSTAACASSNSQIGDRVDGAQPLRDHRLASIANDVSVGPFAHLRPDADVARRRARSAISSS